MSPEQFAELQKLLTRIAVALEAKQSATAAPAASSGAVFPPYGRSKGQPVSGASEGDLRFYAGGCRRSLGDESKQRFHAKERALLDAILAEARRQGVDIEEPENRGPQQDDFGPPPHDEAQDDIPF